MEILCLITILGSMGIAAAHYDPGEYGYYSTYRKTICDKNDHKLYEDIDNCFKLEAQAVQDAAHDCVKEASPNAKDIVAFVVEGCKDKSLYQKFDKCFEEFEANPAFKKQLEIEPKVEACYNEIFKKYNMGDLSTYTDRISTTV